MNADVHKYMSLFTMYVPHQHTKRVPPYPPPPTPTSPQLFNTIARLSALLTQRCQNSASPRFNMPCLVSWNRDHQPRPVLFSITGRSCRKYHFCRDKHVSFLSRQTFCRDKHVPFVATNDVFCRDKYVFVSTKVCLS